MKKSVQYLIFAVLLLIGFIATGERYVFHLSHFENTFYSLTFQYDIFGTNEQSTLSKEKILETAQENDFDIFTIKTVYISDYQEIKHIYGTNNAIEKLKSRAITNGIYHSLFIGQVEIICKSISDIENIHENDKFYYFGTVEDAVQFKKITNNESNDHYEIIDLNENSGSEKGIFATLILVWGTVFFINLLITLFNLSISKKEIFARLTVGDDPYRIFLHNSIQDAIVFLLLYTSFSYIVGLISPIYYKMEFQYLIFLLMLMINTILHYSIINISYNKAGVGNYDIKKTLVFTYIIKSFCVIIALIILSTNCILISESIRYINQSSFFQTNNDYSYINIRKASSKTNPNDIMDENKDIKNLWYEIDSTYGERSIRLFDMTETFGFASVLTNRNGLNAMKSFISYDLMSNFIKSTEDKIYIFYPSDFNKTDMNLLKKWIKQICVYNNNELDISIDSIPYKGQSNFVAFNKNKHVYNSVLLNNPIVILDNVKESFVSRYLNPLSFSQNCLYNVSLDELLPFLNQYNITQDMVVYTNALELYSYFRIGIEQTCKIISCISVLIIFLEWAIILLTVRMQYILNGKELMLKRILGYNIFQQNINLFASIFITIMTSVIISIVFINISGYGAPIYAIICGGVLAVFEYGIVLIQCLRMNRIKMILVLKGIKM